MSKVLFIADLHLGDKNIVNWRPMPGKTEVEPSPWSPRDHDRFLVENILSSVSKRDTLWLLGDVCFDAESLKSLKKITETVRQTHIVLGDHDGETKDVQAEDYLALDKVKVHGLVKYKGMWLSHAPIHPQELWGKPNIHGHVHSATVDDDRYLNACVEAFDYQPVSLEQIKEEFNKRGIN